MLPNFTVSGAIDLYVDADLANKRIDQIKVVKSAAEDNSSIKTANIDDTADTTDETTTASGTINLAGIQLLSDAEEATTTVELFADEESKETLKNQVTGSVKGISYSPIYKYDAEYNEEDGTVTFARFDETPSEPEEPIVPEPIVPDKPQPAERHPTPRDFNPSLYSAAVSNIITGFVQTAVSDTVFSNSLAHTDNLGLSGGDMPKIGNTWISLIAVDDDVDIKHFYNVDSKQMSIVGGVNSDKISLGTGKAVWGLYAGYLNGTLKYTDNKVKQNGGYTGFNVGYEQNNFVTGATANIGFIRNEDKNLFGNDKFNTYWTGVSIKSGYNQALGYGFSIQPNLQLGYTYANAETYTTKAGVKIKNDAMHLWETALGAELSKTFDNDWRGFARAKYAFVARSGGDVQANNLILPHIGNKNYTEYGLGVEKALSNKWKLASEVNRREGGREGWNIKFDVKFDF